MINRPLDTFGLYPLWPLESCLELRLRSAMELKIGLLVGIALVLVNYPSAVLSDDQIDLEEQPQNDLP